jgi:hypothetical protein
VFEMKLERNDTEMCWKDERGLEGRDLKAGRIGWCIRNSGFGQHAEMSSVCHILKCEGTRRWRQDVNMAFWKWERQFDVKMARIGVKLVLINADHEEKLERSHKNVKSNKYNIHKHASCNSNNKSNNSNNKIQIRRI